MQLRLRGSGNTLIMSTRSATEAPRAANHIPPSSPLRRRKIRLMVKTVGRSAIRSRAHARAWKHSLSPGVSRIGLPHSPLRNPRLELPLPPPRHYERIDVAIGALIGRIDSSFRGTGMVSLGGGIKRKRGELFATGEQLKHIGAMFYLELTFE